MLVDATTPAPILVHSKWFWFLAKHHMLVDATTPAPILVHSKWFWFLAKHHMLVDATTPAPKQQIGGSVCFAKRLLGKLCNVQLDQLRHLLEMATNH